MVPHRRQEPVSALARTPRVENVWDFPRPPRVEPSPRRARVELGGVTVADSARALRVLETSHPPALYLPPQDVDPTCLRPAVARATVCEFKGVATYLDVVTGDRVERAAAWTYRDPVAAYAALRDHIAFYPLRMDACWLDAERARGQAGDFYGGWITDDVAGPFKGGPGTAGW
jgi:uncharacterized protein (DUF427 family)